MTAGIPPMETVKTVAAGLAGAFGALCLLWFLASTFLGVQLVVLTTGSMGPGMPAGTGAVTVPVTADAIAVGDVLTVERGAGALPITHRVIGLEPDPSDAGARIVRMRGDANAHEDPKPYRLRETDRVLFSVPYLGTAALVARSPIGLAIGTLTVAVIVVWVFWPPVPRAVDELDGSSRVRA